MSRQGGGSTAPLEDEPFERRGLYVMLAGLAVLLAMSIIIGKLVRTHDGVTSRGWDTRVARWMADHRTASVTRVAADVSLAGSVRVLVVATLVGGAWLWWRTRRVGIAMLPLVALVTAQVIVQIVKGVVARARPSGGLASSTFAGWAWPSGHAASVSAVAASACVVMNLLHPARSTRLVLYYAVGSIAVLVSASRVVLGAHWVSDVLMGDVVGVAVVSLFALSVPLRYVATERPRRVEIPVPE